MSDTKFPHDFKSKDLGHSNLMCSYCFGTPSEIAFIGDMNYCEKREKKENVKSPDKEWTVELALEQIDFCNFVTVDGLHKLEKNEAYHWLKNHISDSLDIKGQPNEKQ